MSTLTITETDAPFAAAITGAKLAGLEDEETWRAIRAAWAAFPVLSFPDQPLSLEELEQVTLRFGAFGDDPYIAPIEGHPHVIEIRRNADEKAKPFAADAWHSDWSFQDVPPAGTMLHAQVIPPQGGDTLFADATLAFEALSEHDRQELEDLRALHSAILGYSTKGAFAADRHERSMKILVSEEAEARHAHPMVRIHPVTGRKSLYINPVYTVGIEGMDDAEAAEILGPLYRHMLKPEFLYRHKWQNNMLLLWDNRRVMHAATGGYDGHARLLHRTTISGEPVIAA